VPLIALHTAGARFCLRQVAFTGDLVFRLNKATKRIGGQFAEIDECHTRHPPFDCKVLVAALQ
jgi:hypothetical protein